MQKNADCLAVNLILDIRTEAYGAVYRESLDASLVLEQVLKWHSPACDPTNVVVVVWRCGIIQGSASLNASSGISTFHQRLEIHGKMM